MSNGIAMNNTREWLSKESAAWIQVVQDESSTQSAI